MLCEGWRMKNEGRRRRGRVWLIGSRGSNLVNKNIEYLLVLYDSYVVNQQVVADLP